MIQIIILIYLSEVKALTQGSQPISERIMPIHLKSMYSYVTYILSYLVVCTRMLLVCTRMLLVCTRMLLVCSFSHHPILKQFTFQSPKFLQGFINNNKRRSLFPCLGAFARGSIPTVVVGKAERDRHIRISSSRGHVTCSVITMK